MLTLIVLMGAGPPTGYPTLLFQNLRAEFFKPGAISGDGIDRFAPRFHAHADRFPNHPSAVEALLQIAGFEYPRNKDVARAKKRLLDTFALGPAASPLILQNIGMNEGRFDLEFLKAVAERNRDPRLRALAWRALHTGRRRLLSMWGPVIPKMEEPHKKTMSDSADQWRKDVLLAESKLKSAPLAGLLATLETGTPAPDLRTINLDSKPVALSALRGKVVLLDFWHTHCGPCIRMIPDNNAFVKEMAGKPFSLVQVCIDNDGPLTARAFQKKRPMSGEQWWADFESRAVEDYAVWSQGYPTLVVIDHEGIIRHRQAGTKEKEKIYALLRELVKKAEKKK